MKHQLKVGVAAVVIGLLPGCEDKTTGEKPEEGTMNEQDKALKEELKEAGEHLKEAGDIAAAKTKEAVVEFGNLLEDEWAEAEKSAFKVREQLAESYQEALDTAAKRLEEWKENAEGTSSQALDELGKAIDESKRQLAELRESGEQNWEASRKAFNVAWQELRDAFAKAKAEFEKAAADDGTAE